LLRDFDHLAVLSKHERIRSAHLIHAPRHVSAATLPARHVPQNGDQNMHYAVPPAVFEGQRLFESLR
jgi:hypothetical protein